MATIPVKSYPLELDAIYIDTYSSYRPLFIHGSEEYAAYDMELQQDIRAAGVFRFSITSRHPLYSQIHPRRTEVTVVRGDTPHWSGYINRINQSTPGVKTCECIGVLDYLNDSIQLPVKLGTVDAEQALAFLLNRHNEQMAGCSHKCVTLGRVSYGGREIADFAIDRPTSTLDVIYQYFDFGAYRFARSPVDLKIDLLSGDDLAVAGQGVAYGENLISLNEEINCTGLATRLMPLGKDGDSYVTISSANGGVPFIDAGTVSSYTPVVESVIFDDISDPAKLLAAGREYLRSRQTAPSRIVKAEAFDRYILSSADAPLTLGAAVPLKADIYGIDETVECTSVTETIGQPHDSRFKFESKQEE